MPTATINRELVPSRSPRSSTVAMMNIDIDPVNLPAGCRLARPGPTERAANRPANREDSWILVRVPMPQDRRLILIPALDLGSRRHASIAPSIDTGDGVEKRERMVVQLGSKTADEFVRIDGSEGGVGTRLLHAGRVMAGS